MAANTTPDGITYPTSGDQVSPLESVFANQANSVQTALNGRQYYSYRWANATARAAQTGMRINDLGYQVDTNVEYRYSGSAWVIWSGDGTTGIVYNNGVTSQAAPGGSRATSVVREGRNAVLNLNLLISSTSPNFDTSFLTLPVGYRPLSETFCIILAYNGNTNVFNGYAGFDLMPDGNLLFKSYPAGGSIANYQFFGSVAYTAV